MQTRVAPSTSRGRTTTPRGGKMTPKGRVEEDDDEDEVFATPDGKRKNETMKEGREEGRK